jgi:hypothetical protein
MFNFFYPEPRHNPEYKFYDYVSEINENFRILSGASYLPISGGTITGETIFTAPISAASIFASSLSATSLSGGIILSGSTDLNDIFLLRSGVTGNALMLNSLSSGLVYGCAITINTGNTALIDITPGFGYVVDNWTNVNYPKVYNVTFTGVTGQSLTYLSSSTQTHLSLSKTGVLLQDNSEETNSQRRDRIMIGQVNHPSFSGINNLNSQIDLVQSPVFQYRDLMAELVLINSGNIISANGANLNINKSSGTLFGQGINFQIDNTNPHRRVISATTVQQFLYRTMTGGSSTSVVAIDPTKYDVGGVITTVGGGSNSATNQRVFLYPNGVIVIQYGQTVYVNLAEAISAIQKESFIKFSNVNSSAILIGIISVQKNCTSLNDTTRASFFQTSRFGESTNTAGGVSTGTLQLAYNNSVEPEILTNSILQAVAIKNGSGSDDNNILEGVSSGGTITSFITGSGSFLANNVSGNTIYSGSANLANIFVSTATTININGNNLSLSANQEWRVAQADTGALTYAGISVSSTTTVNIGACTGYVINNETDASNPSYVFVNYPGESNKTVTTLSGGLATYVLLNSASTIVFQNTFPNSAQRKTHIYLSKIGHPTGTVSVAGNEVDFITSPLAQFRDVFQELKYINSGVFPSANGVNLNFNTSAGYVLGDGINFVADKTSPNTLIVTATSPCSFFYRTQTGAGGAPVTAITPGSYDVAGVVTAIPGGANVSTLQYVYLVPGLGFVVQYGQTTYTSLASAVSAVGKEANNVIYPSLIKNAIIIGVIALKKSTTDLSNTNDCLFFTADILGQLIGSSAGVSTGTLQIAYNNSVEPEILTNSTLGPLSIKNGASASDSITKIFNGIDFSGNTTSYILANGDISGNTISANGFNIKNLSAGTSVNNIGIDASGNFIIGNTGGSTFTGGTVTGATIFTNGLTARINKRITIVTTSATPTLNTDVTDIARLTGLTTNVTNFSTNLTGTPNHGDMFCYEITDNGTARTLAFGTTFSNTGTLSLPTTTVISTLLRCLFQWNGATSKWEIVAVV